MTRYTIPKSAQIGTIASPQTLNLHLDQDYADVMQNAQDIVFKSCAALRRVQSSMDMHRRENNSRFRDIIIRYFVTDMSDAEHAKLKSHLTLILNGLTCDLDLKIASVLHRYSESVVTALIAGGQWNPGLGHANHDPNRDVDSNISSAEGQVQPSNTVLRRNQVTGAMERVTDSAVIRGGMTQIADRPRGNWVKSIDPDTYAAVAGDKTKRIVPNIDVRTGAIHMRLDRLSPLLLIHEASHRFAGTIDITYFDDLFGFGSGSPRNTNVLGNAGRAIWNADSIAWFVLDYSRNIEDNKFSSVPKRLDLGVKRVATKKTQATYNKRHTVSTRTGGS